MREFMRRTAFGVLTLVMVAAACLWQSAPVEAAAHITWTTTDVILEKGKCTVKGYFTNDGDMDGTVTKMKFIVDTRTPDDKNNIYSAVWEYEPKNCFVKAGAQINWWFQKQDPNCPVYTGNKHASVQRFIWVK